MQSIARLISCPNCIFRSSSYFSKEIVYSNDRLRYPLLRVGERGEGKFERIDWDEALDCIALASKRIKNEHGAQAVMSYFTYRQ